MLDPAIFRIAPDSNLDLDSHDPDAKTGFEGGKEQGEEALDEQTQRLAELQGMLWGESRRSLLLVLQATDTAGKDGTIRHVFRGVNPQGVRVTNFGVPSDKELAHDYLWRVHQHTPADGEIGIFNRSHYEDVLVVRVKGLQPESVWSLRYRHIREFEQMLSDEGTVIVKVFLNISKDEQKKRLEARLAEPDKNWKFRSEDLRDRELWDEYRKAYQDAIRETSSAYAPWYVVPANRKWYRNLVVSQILIDTLEVMDPRYPAPEEGLADIVVT